MNSTPATSAPEYLYHYTSVEALALILKNRNIKFSPLTTLDDRLEEKVKDKQKYGKFVFVSSWTEDSIESIPMWKMYTSLENGIRIKMHTYPFMEYNISSDEINKLILIGTVKIPDGFKMIFRPSDFVNDIYAVFPFWNNDLLYRIEYTEEQDKLEPNIFLVDGKETRVQLGLLGKYKRKYWEFQKEWRYILQFSPVGISEMLRNVDTVKQIALSRFNNDSYNLPFYFYFLSISEDAYLNMELTLSPKISDGNRILIDILKEKYNPAMTISESDLLNNIR